MRPVPIVPMLPIKRRKSLPVKHNGNYRTLIVGMIATTGLAENNVWGGRSIFWKPTPPRADDGDAGYAHLWRS